MNDEKIIQEQRRQDGGNLDSTAEPKVVTMLDGNQPRGAAAAKSFDDDACADGLSGDAPISDENVRDIREPVPT